MGKVRRREGQWLVQNHKGQPGRVEAKILFSRCSDCLPMGPVLWNSTQAGLGWGTLLEVGSHLNPSSHPSWGQSLRGPQRTSSASPHPGRSRQWSQARKVLMGQYLEVRPLGSNRVTRGHKVGPLWSDYYGIGLPSGSEAKTLPALQETQAWSRRSGRPPGGGNGNPLQYSCLENPTHGRAWWATVHAVTESDMTEVT